jgi:hypothetical protein
VSDVYRKFLALVQSVYSAEQQALLTHLPNDEDIPSLLALRNTAPPKPVASPSPPPVSPPAVTTVHPPSAVAPVAVTLPPAPAGSEA